MTGQTSAVSTQPVPYPHPLIAREGWPFMLAAALAGGLLSVWAYLQGNAFVAGLAGFVWLLFLFMVQFFRDPPRSAPVATSESKPWVLSPADGRIVAIEQTFDPYANRDALKISVFMNVFNVHSNRAPVSGQVQHVQYFPGQFLNADLDKASTENERNAMVLRTDDGHVVTAVQVAGLIARRILCYVKPGSTVSAGERYGFIRFGSRVDVYLPLSSKPLVIPGDIVSATSTPLAELA